MVLVPQIFSPFFLAGLLFGFRIGLDRNAVKANEFLSLMISGLPSTALTIHRPVRVAV
jgi:hypothetical protein